MTPNLFKKNSYIGCLLALNGSFSACSTDDMLSEQRSTTLTFHVQTRATAEAPIVPDELKQHTHLYVAERLPAHKEDLHCAPERRYVLTGGKYSLTDLNAQWYKFAFVCVPKWEESGGSSLLTEENPIELTCDFNKLLIDYTPVLLYQKSTPNISATQDLNVYRKVLNRWIDTSIDPTDPNTPNDPTPPNNTENVVMQRVTGELVIDMGIPADQFPVPLKSIVLSLKHPNMRLYVRDGVEGEVFVDKGNGGDIVYELNFADLTPEEFTQAMEKRQKMHFCLLPEALEGTLTVNFKQKVPGIGNALVMDIGKAEGKHHVEVRKNQVTSVLYNGMEKNEFEVRYAGFNDDAFIGVEEDKWNDYPTQK